MFKIIAIAYVVYKLVKGGYVSFTAAPAVGATVVSLGDRAVAFLKSVF